MPVHFVSGDLFANEQDVDAFAHGCNCRGSMGAGIAVGFRERYPDMYLEYRRRCKAVPRQFNPGNCFLWKANDKLWVFNLATQEDYWRSRATYEAIERLLIAMRTQADVERVRSIAVPRIGTGYGASHGRSCARYSSASLPAGPVISMSTRSLSPRLCKGNRQRRERYARRCPSMR